ncbi:MAG: hypothetical protein IPI10_10595 [Bacteroidetes bacterium]|nr:hypothetical protein [Bacteroidota bacterium]
MDQACHGGEPNGNQGTQDGIIKTLILIWQSTLSSFYGYNYKILPGRLVSLPIIVNEKTRIPFKTNNHRREEDKS